MLKVLVTGGRAYQAETTVHHALHLAELFCGPIQIIQGGARGADMFARLWSMAVGRIPITERADWNTFGRAAGSIRNGVMIEKYKPDLVIAFPGGRGTADMVRRAKAAGVRVWKVGTEPTKEVSEGDSASLRSNTPEVEKTP